MEIFTHRLLDLGMKQGELEDMIRERTNPNLVRFAELLLDKVDRKLRTHGTRLCWARRAEGLGFRGGGT